MVPGTGVPALPSWLSSLVLFPLLHPELHFSPLMFALGGPNSQCSALEKVTWSSECNHFFFFLRKLCFFLFYFFHFCSLLWYSIYSDNNTINLFKMHLFCMRRNHKIPPPANGSAGVSHLYFIITLDQLKLNLLSFLTIQGIYPSKVNLHVTTFHLMSCEISPPLILPDTTRSPDYTRLITK